MMHRKLTVAATALLCGWAGRTPVASAQDQARDYRPPSVPLVACNPFFSIWSNADKLTDVATKHWTKKDQRLTSMVRVDGQTLRVMGDEPASVEAMAQQGHATVLPTRSVYEFEGHNVHLTLTFFQPALPTDVAVLSRPLTYLTWSVRSTDGQPHAVQLFFSASSALAVDHLTQQVGWAKADVPGMVAMRTGTPEPQPYVIRNGDHSLIDWGYAYVAADEKVAKGAMAPQDACFAAFAKDGSLPADDMQMPRPVNEGVPTLALTIDAGQVSAQPVERRVMIAYDDVYAVNFFGKKERGYWRKGDTADGEHLLAVADKQYAELLEKAKAFDQQLVADITKVGGADYAYMCSLAYRQTIAACGITADANGQPQMFTKENNSNGNMGTVDVLFPMSPVWVFLCPTLAKATAAPVFVYSSSPQWQLPYAPHDLGEYPVCFTKASPDGLKDKSEAMPVEESGNMIILADAIAHADGNTKFSDPWWPQMTRWVKYLEEYGLDPEEQLCTDDFNGRLAHNSNLAVKAIVGLGAYADLAKMRGDQATYDKYIEMARRYAKHWMQVANDGDHYRLAYNKPGTWSQLYNMVFDKILGLDIFPKEVYEKELAHYKTVLKPYGMPLDNRNMRTKADWTVWTASMADSREQFEALIAPMQNYLQTTPDRVPFSDGYFVDKLKGRVNFFNARPVIGGVFVRMLTDETMWKKWAGMDKQEVGTYAPMPLPPLVKSVVPTMGQWKYTTSEPGQGWEAAGYDDGSWKTGAGGFGHGDTGGKPKVAWNTADIWLRRSVTVPAGDYKNLQFDCFHDEDVEIYVNGVLAAKGQGFTSNYMPLPMTDAGRAALKIGGKNEIAVHCHQTTGGQYIDLGLADVTER